MSLEEVSWGLEEGIIIWIIWINIILSSASFFKQYGYYYFSYELRFNGVFSRDNLPRMKDGVYVINLDNKPSEGTHWVSLCNVRNTAVYFGSFGIKYVPQVV